MIDCSGLFQLQEFDLKVDELREAIEAQKNRVKKLAFEIEKASALLRKKEALLQKIQLRSRKYEMNLNELNEKIRTSDIKLKSAGLSPSFYTALQKEIKRLKSAASEEESRVLEDMEKLEILQKDIAQSTKVIAGRNGMLDKIKAEVAKENGILEREIEEWRTRRSQVSLQISGDLLEIYEEVRRKTKGRVIYETEAAGCSACGMGLPGGFINSLSLIEGAKRCPYCEVLLYWTGVRDGNI